MCVDEAKAKYLLQEVENRLLDGCLCVGGVAGELWLAPINIGLNKPLGRIHRNNNVISNSVFPLAFRFICFFSRQISDIQLDDKSFNYCFEPPASRADAKQENLSNFSFSAKWQQKLLSGQKFRTSLVPLVLSVLPLHLTSRLLHLKQANRWCQIGGCTRHLIALHMYKSAIAINILWHLPEPLINNASGSAFTN